MTESVLAERRLRPALRLDEFAAVRRGREVVRVDHLAFDVGSHVLTGANGSGKSTLLSALAGLMESTGTARVADLDVRDAGRTEVAYLPQESSGLEHLTVREAIAFARHVTGGHREVPVDDYVGTVGLEGRERTKIGRLSGGERRLAYIAVLLAQEASVLLLDEPTVGLDASHRLAVRTVLREAAATCVVVTATHLPDDLDALADRLVMLRKGEVVFDGTPATFRGGDGSDLDWDAALSRWERS